MRDAAIATGCKAVCKYINREINMHYVTLASMPHVLTVGASSAATPITRMAHWERVKGHN